MKARTNKSARRRGFTVVELTIGMTVMLVAVMTTMASQLVALDLVKSLREQNAAMNDLQSAMDEVQLLPPDDIPIATSAYADNQVIAAYTDLHLDNQTITCDYPGYAGAAVPDPLQIVLTCDWTDWKGRRRTMRLNSAVTR